MLISLVTDIIAAEVYAELEQSLLHFFTIAAGHGYRCRRTAAAYRFFTYIGS